MDSRSAEAEFKHAKMQADELRLLKIATRSNRMRLAFDVVHIRRERAPPYTAISYTWGEEPPTETIYLDRKKFSVSRNLWSCLRYIALDLMRQDDAPRYIWVDAICINQTDDLERNSQVRMMDVTYSKAGYVSIWLGLVPFREDIIYEHLSGERYRAQQPIKEFEIEPFDWEDSQMSRNLANRAYWTRVWIIQEVLLAEKIFLYCSNNRTDWENFRDIVYRKSGLDPYTEIMGNPHEPSDQLSTEANDSRELFAASPLILGRRTWPIRTPESLFQLLIRYRNSECRDRRDRVFALLGLLEPLDRTSLERFFPDYKMKGDDVAMITLAHLIYYDNEKITVESDDIFMGLGILAKWRRRELIRRAMIFDYFDPDAMVRWKNTALSDACVDVVWDNLDDLDDLIEGTEVKDRKTRYGGYCVFTTLLCASAIAFFAWSRKR